MPDTGSSSSANSGKDLGLVPFRMPSLGADMDSGTIIEWLVHPGDRTLTVYALIDGQYGRPDIYELKDHTPIGVLPGVSIAWDALVTRLPQPEY